MRLIPDFLSQYLAWRRSVKAIERVLKADPGHLAKSHIIGQISTKLPKELRGVFTEKIKIHLQMGKVINEATGQALSEIFGMMDRIQSGVEADRDHNILRIKQ